VVVDRRAQPDGERAQRFGPVVVPAERGRDFVPELVLQGIPAAPTELSFAHVLGIRGFTARGWRTHAESAVTVSHVEGEAQTNSTRRYSLERVRGLDSAHTIHGSSPTDRARCCADKREYRRTRLPSPLTQARRRSPIERRVRTG